MRITIVEDNIALAQSISLVLEDAGHAVTMIHEGASAVEFLKSNSTDILILDINLPQVSGHDILRGLRANGNTIPVLFLTARGSANDRVAGLDLGADDYLVKPFDMSELEARIRVLMRRTGDRKLLMETIGQLVFNHGARIIFANEQPLDLPRREMMLFECLLSRRSQITSKSQIAEFIFGLSSDADEKSIETYVSRLRKRIAPYGVTIKTARGLGYMLQEVKDAQ